MEILVLFLSEMFFACKFLQNLSSRRKQEKLQRRLLNRRFADFGESFTGLSSKSIKEAAEKELLDLTQSTKDKLERMREAKSPECEELEKIKIKNLYLGDVATFGFNGAGEILIRPNLHTLREEDLHWNDLVDALTLYDESWKIINGNSLIKLQVTLNKEIIDKFIK